MGSDKGGSFSFHLPVDQTAMPYRSGSIQLSSVEGRPMMGQISHSLGGSAAGQSFLSDFFSPDDCDSDDYDPSLAGISSFRELLSFGVPDDDGLTDPTPPNLPTQDQRLDLSTLGVGFKGSQAGFSVGEMGGNGMARWGLNGQLETQKSVQTTGIWRGQRLESQGGEIVQKKGDKWELPSGTTSGIEGSKAPEVGFSSGGCSLDQQSDGFLVNGKCETSRGLDSHDGVSSSSAMRCTEEEEPSARETGVPVWVKSRGKWQACIQCSIDDCSIATIKAKPTYSKKTYSIVYFPAFRTYAWIDDQHVLAISECPKPLADGSHENARESVKDVDMPRRAMLKRLAANMCDVSDRLPIKAVIETAQYAEVWKSFAKEAIRSKDYSDIGKLLVRLSEMIVRRYIKQSWINKSFNRWKNDCENARSASSIEKLNKELTNAILWEDVALLWAKPEQSTLGSEWKDWKDAVGSSEEENRGKDSAELDSIGNPSTSPIRSNNGPSIKQTGLCDADSIKPEPEVCRQIPAPTSNAEPSLVRHTQLLESHPSAPQIASVTFFPVESSQNELQKDNIICSSHLKQTIQVGADDIISPPGKVQNSSTTLASRISESKSQEGIQKNSQNFSVVSRRLSMKGRFCLAFVASKNRQCNRFANEGSLCCSKHLNFAASKASESSDKAKCQTEQVHGNSTSIESPPVSCPRTSDEFSDICRAITKNGRRCTFKVIKGSVSCKRHSILRDAIYRGEDSTVPGDTEQHRTPEIEICPENLEPGALFSSTTSSGRKDNSLKMKLFDRRRCIGWCKSNREQCSHKAKSGTLYCKKHLWLESASGGASSQKIQPHKSHIKSKGEKLLLSKLVLNNYMENALTLHFTQAGEQTWQKSKKELADKVVSVASKDRVVANILLTLVMQQKQNIEETYGLRHLENPSSETPSSLRHPQEHGSVNHTSSNTQIAKSKSVTEFNCSDVRILDEDHKCSNSGVYKIRCSLCMGEFSELVVLGDHWKTLHHKEAQSFLKTHICKVCAQELADKPAVDQHWKAQHEDLLESPAVLICVLCKESFVDGDILWEHVVTCHSDHLIRQPTALSVPSIPNDLQSAPWAICPTTSNELGDTCHGNGQGMLIGSSTANANAASLPPIGDGNFKYKCKFCGQKFRILPDLGRHHRAEHMNSTSTCSLIKKRKHDQHKLLDPEMTESAKTALVAPLARRWKKLSRLAKDELNSLLQIKATVIDIKQNEPNNMNGRTHEKPIYPGDGKGLPDYSPQWNRPSSTGLPSGDDILSVASSACCVYQLCSILGKKCNTLPDELPQKALEFCRNVRLDVEWIREDFVCPSGCREHLKVHNLAERLSGAHSCAEVDITARSSCLQEKSSSDGFSTFPGTPASSVKIICEDVSCGQESVPVPCLVDEDVLRSCSCLSCKEGKTSQVSAPDPLGTFSYITRRMLNPSLGLDTKNSQLGCSCKESKCSPASCDHVAIFDSDNGDASDIHGQPMRGRFPYNSFGQIMLQEGYLVYECNSSCHCEDQCINRVLQKGVRVKLEIFKTCHKGWAVRAAQHISRGTFVCEYVGEVLDDTEANKRGERYDMIGCSYLYDIDVHLDHHGSRGGAKPFVVDATRFGNVSRFINHSCAPNLINYQVLVESMDCQLAHIGLYARRDIAVGEELSYDYRYKLLPGKGFLCHCGADKCRGRLY